MKGFSLQRICSDNFLYCFFLFLFFYSNLITRVSGINANIIFYILLVYSFIYSISFKQWHALTYVIVAIALYFSIFIFDYRTDIITNIKALKDFVMPLLSFTVGCNLVYKLPLFVNFINKIYFPFILYGIIQEICFFTDTMKVILPWDAHWIAQLKEEGANNLYQGFILRFFGTMNAFQEYQLVVVVMVFFLWGNIKYIKNTRLFVFNCVMALIFNLVAFERTPLLMMVLLFVSINFASVRTRIVRLLGIVILAALIICTLKFSNLDFILRENPVWGDAYGRLINIVLLDFEADSSIADRKNILWEKSKVLAYDHIGGLGPGYVSPASQSQHGAIQPHNNYLVYWLGYGLFGLLIMIAFLYLLAIQFSRLHNPYKNLGFGLLFSFAAFAVFYLPFVGKSGILFFLVAGFLANSFRYKGRKIVSHGGESLRGQYCSLELSGVAAVTHQEGMLCGVVSIDRRDPR